MRPLKLTISAFESYIEETTVDFEQLGENGLFLITGDSGSGKTTLFDAMIFALYGDDTSKESVRKGSELRSKYASENTKTFVEFTFISNGKKYQIKRNPDYEYVKTFKNGKQAATHQPADAELILLPDHLTLASNVKDTTKKITKILGIDRDQFSQIAMLPQGKFVKFLSSETKDRIKFLRKIFNTDPYVELQRKLTEENSVLKEQCRIIEEEILNLVDKLRILPDFPIPSELQDLPKDAILTDPQLEQILSVAKEYLDNQNTKLAALKTEDSVFGKKINELNQEIGRQDKIHNLWEAKRAAEKILEIRKPLLDSSRIQLEEIRAEEPEKKQWDSELITLKNQLKKYDEKEAHKKDFEKKTREKGTQSAAHDSQAQECVKLKADLSDSEKELENLDQADVELEKVETTAANLEKEKKQLDKISEKIAEYNRQTEIAAKKQQEYEEIRKQYDLKGDDFHRKESAFLDAQAGLLADRLRDKPDHPCPVCGSVHHPQLAEKPVNIPDRKEIDSAKKELSKIQKENENASRIAGEEKTKADELRKQIEETLSGLIGSSSFEEKDSLLLKKREQWESESNTNKNLLAEAKEKVNRKNKLKDLILKTKTLIKKKEAAVEQLKSVLERLENDIVSARSAVDTLSKDLPFEDKKEAEDQHAKLVKKIKDWEAERDKRKNEYDDLQKEIDKAETAKKSMEDQLAGAEDCDPEQQKIELKKLEEEKSKNQQEIVNISSRIDINKQNADEIRQKRADLAVKKKKSIMIGSLANTANGSISGKERIDLETLILQTYFDQIIVRANRRFQEMTNDQYEFTRKETAADKRSQSGLDLCVFDYFNGSTRPAMTLSGGEQFIAALALALGLADEVQTNAGGIQLDSMFIDEGFGSLSEDFRDQAIHTLSDQTAKHRLVGIISHVSELKDSIPLQILVSKNKNNGSTIKLIN
ncbi:MAG: SMC family ATPase [Planctomycetia bacterium]|nr:SMC family ATPase [Planctomycetia bacterium]